MKAYPLIYSRTKLCDYVSGFLARPGDINWHKAAEYVNEALEDIKYTGGIRYAVFSVGDYLVYGGTACVTSLLIEKILIERNIKELDYEYKEYQADKAGRPLIFFIGFAIKKRDISFNKVPDIDLYNSYKCYLDFLKKQWLSLSAETEIIKEQDTIEVREIEYSDGLIPDSIEFDGKCFIKNFDNNKYKSILNYYFMQMVKNNNNNYSFLSSVLPDNIVNCKHFKNISIYGISPEEYIKGKKLIHSDDDIATNKKDIQPELYGEIDAIPDDIPYHYNINEKVSRNENLISPDDLKKKLNPDRRYVIVVIIIVLAIAICAIITKIALDTKKEESNQIRLYMEEVCQEMGINKEQLLTYPEAEDIVVKIIKKYKENQKKKKMEKYKIKRNC